MKGGNENKKGLWSMEEDRILTDYIRVHGKGKWNRVAKLTGLKRCGKSCRLRWMNYLSPSVKRGDFSQEEEDLIIRLHNLLGNRWSLIAGRVPGRTDNQVKNHWNSHLSKKLGLMKKSKGFNIYSIPNSQESNMKQLKKNIISVDQSIAPIKHNKTVNTEDGLCCSDFHKFFNYPDIRERIVDDINNVYKLNCSYEFFNDDASNNTTSDHLSSHKYSLLSPLLDFPPDFAWDCL